jgi:glutamyl-tRNA synthetase
MTQTPENKLLADLLFPPKEDHTGTVTEPAIYEDTYPPRDLPQGAAVTRLGPSPTGFIHLGNLYTAFMNEKLARETGGVFMLRIEDTDSKREVEGAVESLIASLRYFGVNFDEGVSLADAPDNPDEITERGSYGPYYQSRRTEIYHTYARKLVEEGRAYPCFLTPEEIDQIRERQERQKLNPGIYGQWAKYRFLDTEEYGELIESGKPYVIRFRAEDADRQITVTDGIRGELKMPGNKMDFVILKSDGIPTYHFAHAVDDHLMRTTHVIRGEEWLSSLPVHADLFEALGFELPVYCHTAVLMKIDEEGKKRKLSKRKDPELSLEYYRQDGYHPKAILEYLLTIINSNFEEWRIANPDAPIEDFNMTTEKMGAHGILFDIEKLRDVSKDVLAKIPAEDLADFLLHWAAMYNHEAHEVLAPDRERLIKILDIGRDGPKPRKDLAYAGQIWRFISYFYEDYFTIEDEWPDNVPAGDIPVLLKAYADSYDHSVDQSEWFGRIRTIATENGYAAKPKDFKKEPDKYKGHVGDVSTVIRIAIVGKASSPDLYEIQEIMGEDEVRRRLSELSV